MTRQEHFLYVCETQADADKIVPRGLTYDETLLVSLERVENPPKVLEYIRKGNEILICLDSGATERHTFIIKNREREFWYHCIAGCQFKWLRFVSGEYNSNEIGYILSRVFG